MNIIRRLRKWHRSLRTAIWRFLVSRTNIILRNHDFSIISNNCWGGYVYQHLGLEYRTPFVGLFLFAEDFVRLLENWPESLSTSIAFIPPERSRYADALRENGTYGKYPIGILSDGIELHFLHYVDEEEARQKWARRCSRLNHENMLFKLSERDGCTDDLILRFDRLPFKHKICFVAHPRKDASSGIFIEGCVAGGVVDNEWKHYRDHLDIIGFLNGMKSPLSNRAGLGGGA